MEYHREDIENGPGMINLAGQLHNQNLLQQ